MKQLTILTQVFLFLSFQSFSQAPEGYYDGTQGITGEELKTTLSNIIDNHTVLSYSALWGAMEDTDQKPNGMVWDMYSDVPGGTPPYEYEFFSDQCGNYSGEGDCYNREHSFPKSWFNDGSPMESDLYHIVPTDGYVNGQRGSYPFGEVGNADWTSLNGSKRGNSSYPGYSGTVFEPIDEYKGDFARGYFYMVTRYESNLTSWSSPMLDGSTYPAFTQWAIELLIDWHEQDPVSTKETDRNNAVYVYQDNRNPFIDHPEFVNLIWGDGIPPVTITSIPPTLVEANALYDYDITTTGGDGSPVTISCTEKPDWLIFSGGTDGTANLSGTPGISNQGDHDVTLIATDGQNQDQQNFTIHVFVSGDDYTETFTLMPPASSAYTNISWTGDHNIEWSATNARTDQEIDGRAVCLKDETGSYLLSQTLYDGISTLSFQHQQKFSGSSGTLTLFINEQQIGNPVEVTSDVNQVVFANIDITGNFTIKLLSDGNTRIAIDNVSWSNYDEVVPQYSLTIETEGNGTTTPQSGTYTYEEGTTVQLTATPDENWEFVEWIAGDTQTNESAFTIIMNSDITATAYFTLINSSGTSSIRAIEVYPNPFSHYLHLSESQKVARVTFINLLGQHILNLENPGSSIDTSPLEPGMYFLKIENTNGNTETLRVLKQ